MTRDEQLIKAALDMAATHARAAFDARSTSRKGHHSLLDWTDGYDEATRACAAAIRAIDVDKLLAKVESETPHAWRDVMAGLRTNTDAVARLVEAGLALQPYLDWTIGPESPGYHPTMASAVAAFKAALAAMEADHA